MSKIDMLDKSALGKENAIHRSVDICESVAGWNQLNRQKQNAILKITSRLLQFQLMEGLGVVGQCVELVNAKRELESQPMTITAYMESVFRQGARTGWRRLSEFEELRRYWPEDVTTALAEKGGALLAVG